MDKTEAPKGPTVEARLEVKDLGGMPARAQLIIHVSIAGEEIGSLFPYSGPKSDLDDFLSGQVTFKGIGERWAERRNRRRQV